MRTGTTVGEGIERFGFTVSTLSTGSPCRRGLSRPRSKREVVRVVMSPRSGDGLRTTMGGDAVNILPLADQHRAEGVATVVHHGLLAPDRDQLRLGGLREGSIHRPPLDVPPPF